MKFAALLNEAALSRKNLLVNPERFEIFIKKIEAGEAFILIDGSTVIIDKSILNILGKDSTSIPSKIETNAGPLSLSQFQKTKEFGSSGGMRETTLNSTITELAPAIAFSEGKLFTDVEKFMTFLEEVMLSHQDVYVGSDRDAGVKFISEFRTSTKYQEKMENAIGILKYIWELDSNKKISKIWWGYRAKPMGISKSHKGDLFVEFYDGKLLGISLKAGGKNTAEPKLNTYVNPILGFFGEDSKKLEKNLYNKVYKKLGLSEDWYTRKEKNNSRTFLMDLEAKDPKKYNEYYNISLNIIRETIVSLFNKDKDGAINFIKKSVLDINTAVPLVVVKGVGTNFEILTEEDDLEIFLPTVTDVKAKVGKGKQDWHIILKGGKEIITMNMTVRTNKSKGDGKLMQGFNLAVKFNSLS